LKEACENIGPRQRRLRLKIGIACIAIAGAVLAFLLWRHAPHAWRLLVLPPLWIGALSLLESRMRTCVMLAARGIRNMDDGNRQIIEDDARLALKRRARSVHLVAAITALLLTAFLVAL
jgi:hypothetical protein